MLPLWMLIPKWWKPLIASAEPSAIPSRITGNAYMRSKKRVIDEVAPAAEVRRRASARITAKKTQIADEPIPTKSELRPP